MRDSFVVQYAVHLWVAAAGITGFWAPIVTWIAAYFLGDFVDRGIVMLDLKIDKLKEALKDPQWHSAALKAYNKSISRVYTEEEKNAIREEYRKALSDYAGFGNGVSVNKHT